MEVKKGARRNGNIEDRRINNTPIKRKLDGWKLNGQDSGVSEIIRQMPYLREERHKKVY